MLTSLDVCSWLFAGRLLMQEGEARNTECGWLKLEPRLAPCLASSGKACNLLKTDKIAIDNSPPTLHTLSKFVHTFDHSMMDS
jgi:hypothetical protein